MRRSALLAVLAVAVFVLGAGGGYFAGWYRHVRLPQASLLETVSVQDQQIGVTVRQGKVASVGPDSITMTAAGKIITLPIDSSTFFEVSGTPNSFTKPAGAVGALNDWFKPGDQVSAFLNNGKTVVLYRDVRTGETKIQ